MTESIAKFEAFSRSPEQFIVTMLPVLEKFRQHHDSCRAGGVAMHLISPGILRDALAPAQAMGEPVMEPAAKGVAELLRRCSVDLVAHWEENPVLVLSEGRTTAAPDDEFARLLSVIGTPALDDWREGASLRCAYQHAYRVAHLEAKEENEASSRKREKASIPIGSKVTYVVIGGEPVGQSEVVAGSAEEGLTCADGTRLRFDDRNFGCWRIDRQSSSAKNYYTTPFEARAARNIDARMIMAVRGLIDLDGKILEPDNKPWPSTVFEAKSCHFDADFPIGNGSMRQNLDGLIEEVLPKADYGHLFAYLTRRFGPPTIRNGDTYKCLSGAWLLTTPHPDLRVSVTPSLSGLAHSLSVWINKKSGTRLAVAERDHYREFYGHQEGDEGSAAYLELLAPYTRALRGFLLDLLRPVWVRDEAMNAQGLVAETSPLMGSGAEYAEASTFAIPFGMADDPEAMNKLFAAVRNLAPLDLAEAVAKATSALKEAAQAATEDAETTAIKPGA